MLPLILVALLELQVINQADAICTPIFSYPGQDAWASVSQLSCNGNQQSPINIDPNDVKHAKDWNPLRFIQWNEYPRNLTITNTGLTAAVELIPKDCKSMPSVVGGGLKDKYEFSHIEFHWGSNTSRGSEHTIGGKRFSAEVQFFTYNTKFGKSLREAAGNAATSSSPDVISIFSAFIVVGDYNPIYEHILQSFRFVKNTDASTYVRPTPIRKFLPRDLDNFWRYHGSFDRPLATVTDSIPLFCQEAVAWTIFKEPIEISERQLFEFYQLTTSCYTQGQVEPLLNNTRNLQDRNGRIVVSADLSYRTGDGCENWIRYDEEMEWRETWDEHSFVDAVNDCIGRDYDGTPFTGLMPVGKLRNFKNYYEYNTTMDHDKMTWFCWGRYFRVNGIKDKRGVWREFPSGSPVIFSHFPEFQQNHGHSGDTLIWDAHLNRLYIDSDNDHYHGICYREYQRECQTCPGYDLGHECTDAGDCMKCAINECACDQGFSGHQCEIPPIPDRDIIVIEGDSATKSEVGNSVSKSVCDMRATYPDQCDATDATNGVIADYFHDRVIACGGDKTDGSCFSPRCYYLDCISQAWIEFNMMPMSVGNEASGVVKRAGKDVFWWVTGGQTEGSPPGITQKTWILDEFFQWTEGPTLRNERYDHCMVQIDDCKVAVIGGSKDGANPVDRFIDVYNFEDHSWEQGPSLPNGVTMTTFTACDKVIDMTDHHTIVVIGCAATTNDLLFWDTATNVLETKSGFTCPVDQGSTIESGKFKQLDDQHLVFTAEKTNAGAWAFDLHNGFTKLFDFSEAHGRGGVAISNRGYVKC